MSNLASTEIWQAIPGHPQYEIGSGGHVRSWKRAGLAARQARPQLLRLSTNSDGYKIVTLSEPGRKRETFAVHRLVAAAFIGPRPSGLETRHLDGNPANCAVSNLAYGTPSQNRRDRKRHGNDRNFNKTACHLGHPFDEINTYVTKDDRRRCRECERLRSLARRERDRKPKRVAEFCKHGHPLKGENAQLRMDAGLIRCVACQRAHSRASYKRRLARMAGADQ